MPTMADLAKLATEVYKGNPTVGAMQDIKSGLQLDTSKASSLGFGNSYFMVWSGEECDSGGAYLRRFDQLGTNYFYSANRHSSVTHAFCVSEQLEAVKQNCHSCKSKI